MRKYGTELKQMIGTGDILACIGIYDAFSAAIAGRHFKSVFISGFSFAASHYGLPDIGLIAWPDMADMTRRVRTILPEHHIVVDMDDGYSDIEVACHAAWNLEQACTFGIPDPVNGEMVAAAVRVVSDDVPPRN